MLWLDDKLKPPWVEVELASLTQRRQGKRKQQSSVFSWNTRLTKYFKAGQHHKTIEHFQQMQQQGMVPDSFTFIRVLNACASLRALEEGRHIHMQIVESCGELNVFLASGLIDMYAKCGSIEDAWRVFSKMPTRNVVLWNAMILGFVKCGQSQRALEVSKQMECEGVEPDRVTFIGLLNACASVTALEEGRHIHEQIIQSGFESDAFVGSSLVNMYAKCGSIGEAWKMFNAMPKRDIVAWNAMILGNVKCGEGQKALRLYRLMQLRGVKPNRVTFMAVLNACASVAALSKGRRVHKQIIQSGCVSDVFVGSSLVDMYAKCGSIKDASSVFNMIPARDVVAWNAMILGHVKCGQGQEALQLSQQMQQEGVVPDSVTYVGILSACASVAALEEGSRVHKWIIERGFGSHPFVANSLVDMYAKCGSIEDARRVFDRMPTHNLISWNAMLGGYAMHGQAEEALGHFEQMCEKGAEMNSVTFVLLLTACKHRGLLDEGLHYFESMGSVYGISATVEQYTCMVDLLGRAGHLDEAEDLIKTMSCEQNACVWIALLSSCRNHSNVKMGERIAKWVQKLDPGNPAGYVLLSSIYATAGKWDLSRRIEKLRLEKGVSKQSACTWIEVNNEMHKFVTSDDKHPQMVEIETELKRLSMRMKDSGCSPDTKSVLGDVEGNTVFHLCHHSEKLAIAFGLISTPPKTPLHIYTNLRVCDDCHTATKFISKLEERAITVRDGNRFHHFEDGVCSCRDYW
jgi:pentatricopeptide repeat protein